MHQGGIMLGFYHMDLRLKAIRMGEDESDKSTICKMLCIFRDTLWVWLCRGKRFIRNKFSFQ